MDNQIKILKLQNEIDDLRLRSLEERALAIEVRGGPGSGRYPAGTSHNGSDIPPIKLQGSDKQVAWATTIRDKAKGEFERMIGQMTAGKAQLEKMGKYGDKEKGAEEVIHNGIKEIFNNPSAQYWIDNKDTGARKMIANTTAYKDGVKAGSVQG